MKYAKTPPMGWNSWDCYGAAVNEEAVRANAKFMADYLKEYGWEYVVVDIQWYEPGATNHEYRPFANLTMDEYGRLLPAVNRFPSAAEGKGFAPLAEYVHSLGLKFGIHIMRGVPRQAAAQACPILGADKTCADIANPNNICEWNPDMYGIRCDREGAREYYQSLLELYASWGVDFIKVDDICREFRIDEIRLLHESIEATGRDIVLSLSPGPAPLAKAEEFKEVANMWRITDDFWDKWELLYDMFDRAEQWCIHSGNGCWPDADMLPIGPLRQDYNKEDWTNFTKEEQITMMSLWAMLRSPLIIGGEMTGFDDFTMGLLTNRELLEITNHTHSAHPLFRKGERGTESIAWFTTHESNGTYYMALFNCDICEKEITSYLPVLGCFGVMDVWSGEKLSDVSDLLTMTVPSHGARVVKLTAK